MGTNNYLMHYRTVGSKNGRTKYPGKYTPVGQVARGDEQTKSQVTQYAMPYVRRVNHKIDKTINPRKYDAAYQDMRKNRERDSRWTDNDYGGREYKDENGNWKYEYYLRPEAKQRMFGESVKETLSDFGKTILGTSPLGRGVLAGKKVANSISSKTDKTDAADSKNITSGSKNGFRISSRTKQNEWTSYAEQQKQAAMARSSADARRKAAEKERLAENSRQRAISNTERRRISGGTAGTNINDYRAKQAERRSAEIAKQREESRTRNSRSAVGNAIADAKANRDVAKFVKADIKDRIKRGKGKVKKLMSKWFG